MNREYILNLPEGEEINKLVAEKVMGWHIGTYIDYRGKSSGPENNDWLDEQGRYMHRVSGAENGFYEDDEDFHLIYWHPSESILWAWEVVEKMQKEIGFFQVGTDANELWYCSFYGFGEKAHTSVAFAANRCASAPLSICRAALLATLKDLE